MLHWSRVTKIKKLKKNKSKEPCWGASLRQAGLTYIRTEEKKKNTKDKQTNTAWSYNNKSDKVLCKYTDENIRSGISDIAFSLFWLVQNWRLASIMTSEKKNQNKAKGKIQFRLWIYCIADLLMLSQWTCNRLAGSESSLLASVYPIYWN